MARGGVAARLLLGTLGSAVALWLVTSVASAQEVGLRASAASRLPALSPFARGMGPGFPGSVRRPGAPEFPHPRPLRSPPLPYRSGDTMPSTSTPRAGAPIYGLLAGRALLAALPFRSDLPGGALPFFDGDAERVIAGVEFSF